MANYEQQKINELLGGGGIWYQPKLAPIFGVNGALVLSQLLYWMGRGARNDGWFYKTQEEMQGETGLTRTKQDNAIKMLKARGVVSTSRKGIPAKRHFKVHMQKLQTCLQDFYKLDSKKPRNSKSSKRRTITKNTAETTHKTTSLTRRENKGDSPLQELSPWSGDSKESQPIDLSDIPF